ncbi:MAG TPA: biotin--[acetyl-CoA-carboxylase] ligase [Rudaea sp.]|jgi:BirA family biotin operon repressor/biotin-[acetyl-CoA-carboxylase] ligase|nr:biotin--[acetyl-CoA-carboxylase] ligase [Rudaea sp.]
MTIEAAALLAALSADAPVSGADLARRLGVTRAAVWKQIESLRDLGAPITAAAGSGYRLKWPFEALDEETIRRELNPSLRRRVHIDAHWQIDSTNTALLRAAADGAADVSVVVAETQSDGRGRRGRSWQSPLGGNVYFSLLKRFDAAMGALAGLSIVAGIALARTLRDFGVRDVGLKWPNDVVVDGRKLAGILVELGGEFLGPCYAVIGIGINVRAPNMKIDQPVTDLATLCGTPPSRNRLVARLIENLDEATTTFAQQRFAGFERGFAEFDALAGKPVRVHAAATMREGVAAGIDARGALRVRHGADIVAYDSADVSVRAA